MNDIKSILESHVFRTYTLRQHKEFNELITNVLAKHPKWGLELEKIRAIRIRRNRLNKSLQLQIKVNKMFFTISWRACITGKLNKCDRLTSAMRTSIRPQITSWKRVNQTNKKCEYCEQTQNLEVDHSFPSFKEIKSQFLQEYSQLIIPTKFILHKSSCGSKFCAKDDQFKTLWERFHKRKANYQYLCKKCNGHKSSSVILLPDTLSDLSTSSSS